MKWKKGGWKEFIQIETNTRTTILAAALVSWCQQCQGLIYRNYLTTHALFSITLSQELSIQELI